MHSGSAPVRAADDFEPPEWVTGFLAGDERIFEAIVRAYGPQLAVFAERIVGASGVAEELVQDVLCDSWIRRDRLVVRDTVRAYLYRAVRNRAFNVLRSDRVVQRWGQRAIASADAAHAINETAQPQRAVERKELAAAVAAAVAALPRRCREAFVLVRQHGFTYAEAADLMGITAKTVDVQIGRAVHALRNALRGVWP
jgi:RNA polymerase sigma-70 factor, ECF subfamily